MCGWRYLWIFGASCFVVSCSDVLKIVLCYGFFVVIFCRNTIVNLVNKLKLLQQHQTNPDRSFACPVLEAISGADATSSFRCRRIQPSLSDNLQLGISCIVISRHKTLTPGN